MDTIKIGQRIKERRTELNLTLQYVADKVKVNKSTIQRYESGNIKDIKLPVIESIAKVLDVDPLWIIGKTSLSKKRSPEYERITYLTNLYFNSVLKWSEDRFFNESETVLIREHFSELLLRYKFLIEHYANSQTSWKSFKTASKNSFENTNINLSDKDIKKIFLNQNLDLYINNIASWTNSFSDFIARNLEEDISSSLENNINTPYLIAAHDDNLTDEEKDVMNSRILEKLKSMK